MKAKVNISFIARVFTCGAVQALSLPDYLQGAPGCSMQVRCGYVNFYFFRNVIVVKKGRGFLSGAFAFNLTGSHFVHDRRHACFPAGDRYSS